MNYKELFAEDNKNVLERYKLVKERISEIKEEKTVDDKYRDYFNFVSEFIMDICNLYEDIDTNDDFILGKSFDELRDLNEKIYGDVSGEKYDVSFANPKYMTACLKNAGGEYEFLGGFLSFLYTEIRGMINYAYESRLVDMTLNMEFFTQVYVIFEDANSSRKDDESLIKELKEAAYYYVSDNCDITLEYRVRENVDPILDFSADIIMNSDLSDLRYLYKYGLNITDTEIKIAKFLNTLSEEDIKKMAKTYTEGYRLGFVNAGKPLDKKGCVSIYYFVGFERVIREAIYNFREMGLKPVIWKAPVNVINRKAFINGVVSTAPNNQYIYDHRFDIGLVLDKALNERRLSVLENAYEKYKDIAALMAGPAVIEIWGEKPWAPIVYDEIISLDKKQQKLNTVFAAKSGDIIKRYIKGEERSFTIISYPIPDIGDNFEEIFKETVKINTLDQELYKDIQQKLIDALDKAEFIRVVGRGDNETYINVAMNKIDNPDNETNFENCLADVNIPLGEVFTSPKLEGTNGLLMVSEVYLNGLKFKNLRINFEEGCISSYSCTNFDKEEDNKKYIEDNILFNHETLPIGEFAIGTNTTAYKMAKKFDIGGLMPILIMEKTGPHFAVGDTCFSWEEEVITKNPDGKIMVAKENSFSAKRKDDIEHAYFNCHTDITIPYDELKEIVAVSSDGSEIMIIEDGRFVLPGVAELNKVLDEE